MEKEKYRTLLFMAIMMMMQAPLAASYIPPDITCPIPANPYPALTGACYRPLTFVATATGNGPITITYYIGVTPILFPFNFPVGWTTVKAVATDVNGFTDECWFTVQVTDTQPPSIICPANISIACPDNIPDPDILLVNASDNCGVTSIIHVVDVYLGLGTQPGFCPSAVERTYRAFDAAGNYTDCMQIITVEGTCGCAICQSQTPHFFVDLRDHCDSLWTSPSVQRNAHCCDATGPDRCISFSVRIDENAIGFYILIDGAAPPGHYYQVDCGDQHPLSDLICIPPGGAYHTVTICKPGSNNNVYQIQSVCGLISPDSVSTRANCSRTLTVSGVIPSTVTWNDITGGGLYNQYLSCTSGCLTTIFTPDSLAPPIIKYRVCGEVSGNPCTLGGIVCDTVIVFVYPEVKISIYPDPPTFCIYDPHPIFASVTPPGNYNIRWWDGPNGTGNIVSTSASYTPSAPGQYSITVAQLSATLPCSEDTLNFEILLDNCILVCPEQFHCAENEIQLYSTVTQFLAAGGVILFPYPVADTNIMLIGQSSDNNQCPEMITHTWRIWDIMGNNDICEEIITLDDTIPPLFAINPDSIHWCVQDIVQAFWDFAGDITPIRPDWHTFFAGGTTFDLNPSTFSDNCTLPELLILHWQILLADGMTISGTGQISSYPNNIIFPLGISGITYWLEDGCGNLTPPALRPVVWVIVHPRPDITRSF